MPVFHSSGKRDVTVRKIDGLLTMDVHNISVPIGRCSPHTLRFIGEFSSWEIQLGGG